MDKYINADQFERDCMFDKECEDMQDVIYKLRDYPPADVVEIPEGGIEDISDGYHTFRDLYYQRMVLFATIVKQNKELAWKSLRHEDGELCFGGDWFIVGIDTPEGSYTYHYETNFWSMFDCRELERGKHWDGHTDKDVTRLLSLISKEVKHGEWVDGNRQTWNGTYWFIYCSECLHERKDCNHDNDTPFCPNCGADMRGETNEL